MSDQVRIPDPLAGGFLSLCLSRQPNCQDLLRGPKGQGVDLDRSGKQIEDKVKLGTEEVK
jgi:hypothetical protein